jgi:hypothetical protein
MATLHEWDDVAAMLALIPDGARRAGFGGLGFLADVAGERLASTVDPAMFRPDIPPGMPVTEEASDEPPRPGG